MTTRVSYAKIITENKNGGNAAERGNKMADNKNIDKDLEISEEEALIITLTDEDGTEIEFEVIGEAEIDGTTYYAMMPADSANADDGIIEYVLLKRETDENGEDLFITLDDEDELDEMFQIFSERLEETFEDDEEIKKEGY